MCVRLFPLSSGEMVRVRGGFYLEGRGEEKEESKDVCLFIPSPLWGEG